MATKENKSRSVVKSISWRIIASCDTILISYLITGSIAIAASIGSIEVLTKMFWVVDADAQILDTFNFDHKVDNTTK